jgi:hypothetical protein
LEKEGKGQTMNTSVTFSKTVRTALVCAGLATAGAAWAADCDINAGDTAAASARSQAAAVSNTTAAKPVSRLDPELYRYLHDPQLHPVDGLGESFGNYAVIVSEH